MKRLILAGLLSATVAATPQVARTLDIYFIDVEGGQATLVVTPSGQSLLMDAGFPADVAAIAPAFNEESTPPDHPRDPERVLAAAKAAGLTKIDYVMMTHSHADHGGGIPDVGRRLPITTFIDHMAPTDAAEQNVKGTRIVYERYLDAGKGKAHIQPKAGATLKMRDVEVTFVAANGEVPSKPLPGAGQPNPTCQGAGLPAQEKYENPFSNGVRLRYGRFNFLSIGDLTGAPLFALACPVNLVGLIDVYQISHHGGNDAADPFLYAAIKPLVAVFNNGIRKGGGADTLATVRTLGIDGWQIHKTTNTGAVNNPDAFITNLDDTTAHWIKISAKDDGSFTVTNPRTGQVKSYKR